MLIFEISNMIAGEGLRPFEGYELGEVKSAHVGLNVIKTLVEHIKPAPLLGDQIEPSSPPMLHIDLSDEELMSLNEQAHVWVEGCEEFIFSATQNAEGLVQHLPSLRESYEDFSRFLSDYEIPADIRSAMDAIIAKGKYGFTDMDLTGTSTFSWDNRIEISLPGIYSYMLSYKSLLEKYNIEASNEQLFPIAFNSILSHELTHLLQQCYGDFVQNHSIAVSSIDIPLLPHLLNIEGLSLFNENMRINAERFAQGITSVYSYNLLIQNFPQLRDEKGLQDDLINRNSYRADLTLIMQGLREVDCPWSKFRMSVFERAYGVDLKCFAILLTIEHLRIHNLFAYAYPFRDQDLKMMIRQTNQIIDRAA